MNQDWNYENKEIRYIIGGEMEQFIPVGVLLRMRTTVSLSGT